MTSAIPFLACALLAAAAPAPAAKPVRVPLASRAQYTPRANGEVKPWGVPTQQSTQLLICLMQVDGPLLLTAINSTLHKYHAARALPTYPGVSDLGILKERAVASEALTDQIEQTEDELYYGPVTVGATTPQQFTADFDTGSSDFFVPGPQCGSGQGCVGTTKYDQGGTDEHNTTSVTYGSGMISGENYFDTVAVAGLSATHTNVISLTSAQGFDQSQSNSLLGMGFGSIAQSKQPTFFENLMSQGKVTNPEFAFYLGRGKSNTQSRSELTLGGTDTARYTGSLTRVPVTTKGFWQVALSSAVVSGKTAPATSGQAAIDTGTTGGCTLRPCRNNQQTNKHTSKLFLLQQWLQHLSLRKFQGPFQFHSQVARQVRPSLPIHATRTNAYPLHLRGSNSSSTRSTSILGL